MNTDTAVAACSIIPAITSMLPRPVTIVQQDNIDANVKVNNKYSNCIRVQKHSGGKFFPKSVIFTSKRGWQEFPNHCDSSVH